MDAALNLLSLFNPQLYACPICARHNRIVSKKTFQGILKLPTSYGEGQVERIVLNDFIEINVADIVFSKSTSIGGTVAGANVLFCFCMGAPVYCRLPMRKQILEMKKGENCIFHGSSEEVLFDCWPGQHFRWMAVRISEVLMKRLLGDKKVPCIHCKYLDEKYLFQKRRCTSKIMAIIEQILKCSLENEFKKMYIEGKILELLAVYMNEQIEANHGQCSCARECLKDQDELERAHQLLENALSNPPTIQNLARCVCLNEYKLKMGFKKKYGVPIHTYVIERRMENAIELLRDSKLNIVQIAQLVGYQDPSHFAATFRKKFGMTPSEYLKKL